MNHELSGPKQDDEPFEYEATKLPENPRLGPDLEGLDEEDNWEHGVWILRRHQGR